ncbi:MAG: alanine racemase [Smithellaceae bacterium]
MINNKGKKPYAKPVIKKVSFADTGKFKSEHLKITSIKKIEGLSVRDLLSEYGSPLYVVSESMLRRCYRELIEAFAKRYSRTTIAYSYKTNYLGGICAILHQEGAWAEVVSGLEYEMAKRLNVAGQMIVFNGPYKKPEEMKRAFSEGATVNLDSADDLKTAGEVAETLGRKVKVGIRVNMQLNYPAWDKFGFSYEQGEAFDVCKQIKKHRYLQLAGLHCHAGTYIIDLGIYRRLIENLASLAMDIKKELGMEMEYLDIGGGFPSSNSLHTQLMPGNTIAPPIEQYAETVCNVINKKLTNFENAPRLILEPGRSVVDECMHLLTRVVAVKERQNGNRAIIVDAGVNLLPVSTYYRYEMASDRDSAEAMEEVDIYGALCMQIDVLRKSVRLPVVKAGDIITISKVGAYNFTQSMQFIYPRPAVVLLHEGNAVIIRRKEMYEDIKGPEVIPARLLKHAPANQK